MKRDELKPATAVKKPSTTKKTVKKTAAKTVRKKAVRKKPIRRKTANNTRVGYILTIMVLLTVIAVLAVNVFENQSTDNNTDNVKSEAKSENVKDSDKSEPSSLIDSLFARKKTSETDGSNQDTKTETDPTARQDDSDSKNNATQTNTTQTRKVNVNLFYYMFNEQTEKLHPVSMQVSVDSDKQFEDTLTYLFKNLSPEHKESGYINALPASVRLRAFSIKDKTAVIDLSSHFNENAIGEILTARLNQLFLTMTQFREIDSIIIRIEGQNVTTFGGDGRIIQWPMRGTI